MKSEYICDPCRNFCILGSTTIIDPLDGQEKFVLSTFVAGGTGGLVFINTKNGEGEWIQLPGDEGAWALLNLNNERLLVGTCSKYGYLHSLELKSRKWAEPLRVENETYIWNLVMGSDSKVYGGTWPGCQLLQYDPLKHTLESVGRASDVKGNQYSRLVYGGVPGKIIVFCGLEKSYLAAWDMKTGKFTPFGKEKASIKEICKDYICTLTDGQLDYYDPQTLQPLEPDIVRKITEASGSKGDGKSRGTLLQDGRLAGVKGQEYFIVNNDGSEPVYQRIPVEAPPTGIMTITAAEDGSIWGSSGFGQTIFRCNPADGTYWNSAGVCTNGGEVYGMRFINGKLFMTAYAGGDHIVYDPCAPWSQRNNANPVTLKPVGPKFIRPHSKSVIGPDGALWTGWMAEYGVYGCGLSKVDPKTLEVSFWSDVEKEQSIESIAADSNLLYFTTGGYGNGLPNKTEEFSLIAWDVEKGEVWRKRYEKGLNPGAVETVDGYVIVAVSKELLIYKSGEMELVHSIKFDRRCQCITRWNNTAAVFCGKELYQVNPSEGSCELIAGTPETAVTATLGADGILYFASEQHLYRVV